MVQAGLNIPPTLASAIAREPPTCMTEKGPSEPTQMCVVGLAEYMLQEVIDAAIRNASERGETGGRVDDVDVMRCIDESRMFTSILDRTGAGFLNTIVPLHPTEEVLNNFRRADAKHDRKKKLVTPQ